MSLRRTAMCTCLIAAGAIVAPAAGAHATSCAVDPANTPAALLAQDPAAANSFLDTYDGAIVGTVRTIVTDERQGSPTYGRTTVSMTVHAAFGVDGAPSLLPVTTPDPGWMSGYPYAIGHTYFVPLVAVGPDGTANHSFVCDPITEVPAADVAATVADLVDVAARHGVPFVVLGDEPVTTDPAGDEVAGGEAGDEAAGVPGDPRATVAGDRDDARSAWPIVLAVGGTVALAGAITRALLVRRRRTTAA